MNSFFARIKRKLNNTFFARYLHKRRVNNNNTNIYNNSFTGIMSAPETLDETINAADVKFILDPKTQVMYFSTILNKCDIESDYSLFDLKRIVTEHNIKIEDLILDDVFESEIDICDSDSDNGDGGVNNGDARIIEKNYDIFKTKMRLFYVIIANNLHDRIFNKKKVYTSSSATHCVGVFQYDNYIIRIDDSPHCFESEKEVIKKIGNKINFLRF